MGLNLLCQNRQLLAERAAANAAQVEAAYGGGPANEADTQGPDSEEDVIQEEYENEEQVATVTVVEDFDMDTLIHTETPAEHPIPVLSNRNQGQSKLSEPRTKASKSTTTNTTRAYKRKMNSPKKVKYETKAARLAEKRKQRARKLEKASRAGGKQPYPSKRRK